MDKSEQLRLTGRLAALKHRLLQAADPAVATVISDDIANVETRLRACQAPLDLSRPDRNSG
jgi:hypothetical protein